mgnify:CR=1 FL=1
MVISGCYEGEITMAMCTIVFALGISEPIYGAVLMGDGKKRGAT